MTTFESAHEHDHEPNTGQAVTPVPAAGALTSLTALTAALNSVDTSTVSGRSGLPMLLFKRDGNGTWSFGQQRIIVEAGSRWAANPLTFQWGYVAFEGKKKLGEHLVSVSQPMPDITKLPDLGVKWQEEWAVNMKCLNGVDAGLEVVLKMSTDGCIKAIVGLLNAVRDRLNGGEHGGNVVPILLLEKDSYQHPEHGRVWLPVLKIVDWMPLGGPAPAPTAPPAPVSPPTEQPRRRRVA
jgi:hypothetical protein